MAKGTEIYHVSARQIFDSRGLPTVEAEVMLQEGLIGRAAVPAGASTGSLEAHELRDGGTAFNGMGVTKAVDNIKNIIGPELNGIDPTEQASIDERMCILDGTHNKSRLGANAILAVSLATAKAAAIARHKPLFEYIGDMAGNKEFKLPLALMNFINGGKHAAGSTDIQEFMIMPHGASDFAGQMRVGSEIFQSLKRVLSDVGYATTVGDEGGFAPAFLGGNNEALDLLSSAVVQTGYELGSEVTFALDVAASELYKNEVYSLATEDRALLSGGMISLYKKLVKRYPIASIEDGLDEKDIPAWQALTEVLGDKTQIVGDDLLVTNPDIIRQAIHDKSANAVLIKPNQVGTLTETMEAVRLAQAAGWKTIMSHRSGETEDTTIAHLAVGLGTDQIKTGSVSRSERLAKYNELLRIEEHLATRN